MSIRVLTGDCRALMPAAGPFDLIIADPPYGDTALGWDRICGGWQAIALHALKPTGSMWVFGSMRFLMGEGIPAGFRYAQDVVWEKHNGSGFASDRFKRVHEHAVQFYRADAPWDGVFNEVQRAPGQARAASAAVKVAKAGAHQNETRGERRYDYTDERIMRSVIPMRSMHGKAIHPTKKPSSLLEILIRTSCPADGLVGDFFAGSGAAGEAAALAGRRYVGCEIDPEMAEKARARLGSNLFAGSAA